MNGSYLGQLFMSLFGQRLFQLYTATAGQDHGNFSMTSLPSHGFCTQVGLTDFTCLETRKQVDETRNFYFGGETGLKSRSNCR